MNRRYKFYKKRNNTAFYSQLTVPHYGNSKDIVNVNWSFQHLPSVSRWVKTKATATADPQYP